MDVRGGKPTKGAVNIGDIVGVSGGRPTKGAVNIGDILGVSGGQPTKGAVNIGDWLYVAGRCKSQFAWKTDVKRGPVWKSHGRQTVQV